MPKLSEVEVRPNDIVLPDVPDSLIMDLRLKADLSKMTFNEYVLHLIADHFETPREAFASAAVIVLDPE